MTKRMLILAAMVAFTVGIAAAQCDTTQTPDPRVWQGTYKNGTTYSLCAVVFWSNSAYVGVQPANIGNQPDTSPAWWLLLYSQPVNLQASSVIKGSYIALDYNLAWLQANVPAASVVGPMMNGVAAPGLSVNYSREDHVHPVDTSRQQVIASGDCSTSGGAITCSKVEQVFTATGTIAANTFVKLDSSTAGNVMALTTGDTRWYGVATTAATNGQPVTVQRLGPVNVLVDGAVTVSNSAVASTSTAAYAHDSGGNRDSVSVLSTVATFRGACSASCAGTLVLAEITPADRGTAPVACVGSPGNTTAPYHFSCVSSVGGMYICNNSAGCTTAADWSSGGGGNGVIFCAPASGSGTTYTCNPSVAITSYSAGTTLAFVPDVNGAGGATTVSVSGLVAKSIKGGDGTSNPASTDFVAGKVYSLTYDGSVFRLIYPLAQTTKVSFSTAVNACTVVSGPGSCTASSTSGYNGFPGVVITHGLHVDDPFIAVFDSGKHAPGGTGTTLAMSDASATTPDVVTLTFAADGVGTATVSTGGPGQAGPVGSVVAGTRIWMNGTQVNVRSDPSVVHMEDHFMSGQGSNEYGSSSWVVSAASGSNGLISQQSTAPSTKGHPGILQATTNTVSGSAAYAQWGPSGGAVNSIYGLGADSEFTYWVTGVTTLLDPAANSGSPAALANMDFCYDYVSTGSSIPGQSSKGLGVCAGTTVVTCNSGDSWNTAHWMLVASNSTGNTLTTCKDTGVAVNSSTWYDVVMWSMVPGTVIASVNGSTPVSVSTNVPTGLPGRMQIVGYNRTTGAKTWWADYVHFFGKGLTLTAIPWVQ